MRTSARIVLTGLALVALAVRVATVAAQAPNDPRELARKLARLEVARASLLGTQEEMAQLRAALAERMAQEAQRDSRAFVLEGPEDVELAQITGESGWLGVAVEEITAEKAKELKLPGEHGVLLREVEADSPAAKAGLKVNDVITEYNGQRVEGVAQFRRLVRETPAGRTVQLTVWRDARSQTVSAQLGDWGSQIRSRVKVLGPGEFNFNFKMPDIHANIFASTRRPTIGISGEDLSGQLGNYFGAPDGEGVLVREVNPGSPAEKAGLKAGDVIIKVDGERVRSVSDLREKLMGKHEKKSVAVGLIRKGSEMTLNVEIEQLKPPAARRLTSRRISI